MLARLGGSVSGRYRPDENILLTKHVVAAGRFAKDAGSTPAASTIFIGMVCPSLESRSWNPCLTLNSLSEKKPDHESDEWSTLRYGF